MFRWLFRTRCFLRKIQRYWRVVIALVLINFTLVFYNVTLFEKLESFIQNANNPKVLRQPRQEPPPEESNKIFDSAGVDLAANVNERCKALKKPYPHEFELSFWIQRMHLVRGGRNLYCPVEKVGTTFWRRVIFQANSKIGLRHPYQVPIDMALGQKFQHPGKNSATDMFRHFFKFLFVRNPFGRILSAYVDKIFVPNPQFWDQFGKHSIQMFRKNDSRTCYHDATFAEFVQFVVWSIRHMKHIDPHFLPSTMMCVPCSMEYSFIGKMETFSTDIYPIFKILHLERAIPELKHRLKELSALDAIHDSISSPYSWRENILKCMDWNEALQRVWRKLQMRGLIDIDIKFPLTKTAADMVSREDFSEMAILAWKDSDPAKLKQQKKDMYIEMYRSVPINVLHEFVKTFHIDFYLFVYKSFPNEIFNRTLHIAERNFVDFWN